MADQPGEEGQVVKEGFAEPHLESPIALPTNIDAIVALMNSDDPSERKQAINTLIPLGFALFRHLTKAYAEGPNTSRFQDSVCFVFREIRKRLNTADLIELLSDKNPEIRVDVVRALRIKSLRGAGLTPEIIRAYIRTLKDSHPRVREEAAKMLCWASPDVEAYSALIQASRDIDPSVQKQAKLSLNSFRHEASASAEKGKSSHSAPRFSHVLDWFRGI